MNNNYDSWYSSSGATCIKAWRKRVALLLFFVMFGVFGVNAQISVTVTNPTNTTPNLSASYTSLASALTAVNAVTAMSGPITLTCTSGTSETAPVKGFVLGSATLNPVLSASNTITINKSGAGAVTINAGVGTAAGPAASPDGMFYLLGADYVTIDGLTFTDGNTASATVAMEYGLALFKRAAGDGCNNNTIQNCTFNMQRINNATATAPMFDGSWGIYVLNSTATAATTSLTPTNGGTLANNGTNSNNKFYSNTINGGNGGIALSGFAASVGVGPTPTATTFLGDLGNDVGGSSSGTGNTILNFGGGAATNPSAGIRVSNQWSVNISYNTVDNNNGSGVNHATTLRGIFAQAATSARATISNNSVTVRSGGTSSVLTAIDNAIGSTAVSSNTIDINNNTIRFSYTTATSGVFTAISNSSTAGVVNINGNNIQQLASTNYPTTGTISVIVGGSPGGALNINNNTISNFNMTGVSGTLRAITASTPVGLFTSSGNTIENLSYSTASSTGSIDGIYNFASATLQNWFGNIIRNFSTPSTGTLRGIFNNTVAGTFNFYNNQIYGFSTTAGGAGGGTFTGITSLNGTANIYNNLIYSLNSTGSTGGTGGVITGLIVGGTPANNVYGNKIYNLSSTSTGPLVVGVTISSGTSNNVYNNLIGDLRATAASGTDVIRGINITSTNTLATNKVYYNTIYLNATSTGTNFGSTGVFHTYSATATTSALDLRNNIIVNASGANGTGLAVAFRRSAATDLNNYATTSNNNLFFGTSGVYNNGTTTYAFGPFQTLVGTRETASKSQNPTFASTTGADANYLNFANGAINLAGGNAQVIAGYTTDYSGATRDASAPDMGAYEFAQGSIPVPTISGFTTAFSPSAPIFLCAAGGSVVTITGTGLDTVSSVLFNGPSGVTLAGTITGQTATSLTVTSPAGVVDGIIRVTNPAGSADSSSSFTTADAPTVGISSAVTICSGDSTTLTATGANTYAWSPSTGLSATTGANVTANPTATTTYTVTGTNTAGCTATNTVAVTVNLAPPAITASASKTTPCLGSTFNLASNSGDINNSFSESFNSLTAVTTNGWTFVNAGSGNSWGITTNSSYFRNGPGALQYYYNSTFAANAWAFTPARTLTAGKTYTITYWYLTGGYAENLKLTVGTAASVAAQTTTLLNQTGLVNTVYTQATATFTPTTSGVYYFGFNCYSAEDQFHITIDDFVISDVIPATYSWTSSPEGFTSSVQNPSGVSASVPTTYTVVVTANGCSKTSSVAITPAALPTIATSGDVSICNGGAGAELTATGGVSYTWSPATGLSAANVANPTATPSTTTTYTVTGTDANGCQNTATAEVTVNTPVAITVQPANQTALENGSTSFSVTATGTGLTYQWEFSSDNGSSWNPISGETASTYTIASASSSLNNNLYRVVVSGTAPCTAVTSNSALLLVGSIAIATQPSNQTICSDGTATFAVTTTGDVTSYLWQYSTNGTDWFTAPGDATGSSLVLSGINSALSGYLFRCNLNNGALISNTATLTVYDAVVIGTQPASQVVCSNAASVTFTSAATGSGLAYKWQVSTNSGGSWSDISGASLATYTISNPGVALNGNQYRVIVSGTAPCSPVTSNAATLTVTDVAVAASSTSVCIGQSVTLTATYTGVPNTTSSSWVSATTGSGATTAISGDTAVVTPTAAGTYVYTFTTNGSCSFTRTVTVTVNPLPVISAVTATPAVVCSDATINLSAESQSFASGTRKIGSGTTSEFSYSIFRHGAGNGNFRHQLLYTAAELSAAGLAAGPMTSIAFNVTSLGSTAYTNYTISLASLSASSLTTTFNTTSTTQVYTASSFTLTSGLNTFAFGTGSGSSGFVWDGVSDILVNICYTVSGSSSTSNVESSTTTVARNNQLLASTGAACTAVTATSTSTVRPNATFAGQVSTNLASTYTWSWNTTPAVATATGTTSVTNTSGNATSRTFTATATSAAGCVNSLTTSAVTVNTTIPAPTGTDSTQCGTATPTCSATGTGTPGNTFRWYTVATGGTAISGQTGSTLVSPFTVAATTTLYVSEVSADGLCESPRTAVIVTVTSPFAFALSASTATNCSGAASLTPVTIATNGGYDTYSWSNAATVSGNETTGWTFSPTTTTTYTLTATGGGCSTTATVVVTPTALPVVTATAAPSSICVGASSTLTALTSVVSAGSATIGAGATTSATYSNPFYSAWSNNHTQHLITAAELTAMGLRAGNITSVGLNVTSAGSLPMIDLSVKIGTTTATAMTAFVSNTGFQTVYTNASLLPTTGVNTLTFTTPFAWDGTSNIILEFCHGNSGSTSTMSRTVLADNTSYVSSVKAHVSGATSAATICADTATNLVSYSVRPQFVFGGQVVAQGVGTLAYTWNDPSNTTGNVLTVSPSTTTAYTVSAYDSVTGCTGTATATVTIFTPPTAPSVTNATQCGARVPTIAVADTNGYTTPTFKWYADETTTTPLQSSTSTTYTTSVSATTTFYVSVVSPGGCESPRAAVTTTVLTPATLSVSPAVTVCTGNSTTLTASGAVSYTWTPGATLDATSGASVVATPTATTTYSVTGVDANGCTTAAATVVVTVDTLPSALSITQGAASVCTNGVMSLTATGGTVGGPGNATSGTGTLLTSSTSYPTAFGQYWYKNWQQYLFTKAELNAAGIVGASSISSLRFNIAALPSPNNAIADYNVKIASTSNTALSAFTTTGLTNVFGPASVTPVLGNNTITFSTPYAWDGNSNIIIDIRQSESYGSANATTYYTATSNNSVIFAYDSVNSSTFYTSSPTVTTSTSRPNVVFGYDSTTNSPVTWSPTTDLYTTAAATTAYTGAASAVVYTKPSSAITYTATATNGACTTSATTTVTPVALPVFTVTDDVTICKGQSVTLEATGSGQTYVWSTTATTASISVSPLATTTYTVTATDTTTGCQSTQEVVVTVTNPGAINPVGTTTSHIAIPGSTKVFTVATQAGPVYTYQWQLNDGSGWVDLSEDATYSNVNTANLTVANIDETMTGYQYQCIVTGDAPCAPLTPIVATLTVDNTGIGQQPQSVTVCAPNSASFSIATTGDEPYGIEWQVSSDNGDNYESLVEGLDAVTGLTFTGVDQLTLEVSGIAVANNGLKFRCLINFYLPSDGATLTVKAPVVASNPVNQTVCAGGGTATFSTTATGSDLTYAWEVSTNNGASWSAYTGTGATTASISVVNPALSADGTQYRVVVSGNAACTPVTTEAATLFINNPTITGQPANASVLKGNAATFTVVPSAATSYQWQRSTTLNGTYTDVADDTPLGITYTGADSATLTVTTSATTATGSANFYRCVVTNNGCSVTSTGGQLTVIFYCTPAPSSVDGIGITNVTMGDINNTTGAEAGNYGDFTAQSTTAERLSTVNFAITYETGYAYGTKIWIDFNDDADFNDAGEQVYYGLSTSSNPTTLTGSFSIPLTAPLGAHRMRIGGSDTDAGVDPCYAGTWATFEDYTINITPAPTCSGTPVAGTASAPVSSLCSGGVGTTITLSGYTSGVVGISFQWYSSTNGVDFAPISGQTSATLSTGSLTVDTQYYCTVTCTESGLTANSNTVAVTVANPLITGSTPAGRCGTGTVSLEATATEGATVKWYTAATGGAPLASGSSFTTPSISTTTTYYAEATTGESTNTGRLTHVAGSGTNLTTYGQDFTITQTVTLNAVSVISTTGTSITISLFDSTGTTQLNTTGAVAVTAGATQAVSLGWVLTPGTYRLVANGMTGNFIRENSNVTYPIALSSFGQINGFVSSINGTVTTSSSYYFMYNWSMQSGCSSARTAVVATVDALPAATISYAGSPYCSTATTATVTFTGTTGGTYSSTAGLSIDPSTGDIDVAASTPGTYTVTYTMLPTTYCTAQTATTTVVINQALTSAFAYDFATYCTNQGTATPTITGSAGTFTASPAGLSINATTGAITLASSAAGTYTVTNTVTVAGCPNSVSTFEITINNAVAITTQPVSVSQLPGDNTSFTVAATGTGLTYQWEVNTGSGWSALSGETAATLSLTAVTAEMNGYLYRVVVSGAATCTSVTSSAATLTVSTAAIATNPVNFTACSTGANTATFAVTTTGTVDTYQWQVSTNNGVDWTNITNGGIYANADTATLSLSGLTLSDNSKQFRCVLNGVVNSNAATLFVKEAVAIATQPSSATGCSAGSTTFTVAATGDGLAYQWQVSTNSGASWSDVAAATSATLTLNSLTAGMNGNQYQVIVSGAAPCSAVTSSAVTLTVNTAVAIGTQPANTTVCNAANATFTVTATGTSLGYQWEVNTGSEWSALSGETNASLTVAAVTTAMSGYQYRVVVSGAAPCGSVTSNAATLTVSQPAVPTITASTLDFCQGSVVTLTAGNIAVGVNSTSFDVLPTNFATNVVDSGVPTAVLNTDYKVEGTGSVLFSTVSNSANVAYGMNTNVNLSGLSNVQLTFSHQALMEGPTTSYDYGFVEYSTNGGSTWTVFPSSSYVGSANTAVFTGGNTRFTTRSYPDWITAFVGTGSLPNNSLWKTETFTIPAGALTSQFRIRFRYTTDSSTSYYGWLIDDVRISIPNTGNTWSPSTDLYTNAVATTAYTGGNATTVYAKPNGSTSYTFTTTNSLGCTNTASVNLNMLAPSTLSSITQPSVTCSGSQTTFALSGLLPNSTSTIGYTINGTAQTAITGVVADASGNATFTVALPAVNNGRTLAVTSLTRTDLTPNCTTAITANNTVVISVQPLVTYYADADGDGFGNNAVTQITCTGAPVGYVTNNTDCDDTDNTKNATYPFYADTDGDGFGAGTAVQLCAVNATTPPSGYSVNNTDCAPNDGTRSQSYSFYLDADGDGYGAGSLVSVCAVNATTPPTGYALNNTDCDDANIALFTTYSFYADTDGDGYGAGSLISVCAVNATTPPTGYSLDNKDCAPTDPTKWRSTLLYIDNDGDGYDNGNENVCWGTTVPTGYSETTLGNDCDDTNPSRNLTNPCETVVTVKMFIEGYYDADAHAMRPVMMNQGVGSSATDVDTVSIELRDATTYELVASATAMLQTNGDAVATFTTAPSGSFYITVVHRNSIKTMSADPVNVGPIPANYDFTTSASKAFGDNQVLIDGVYAIFSGDLNQDGYIDIFDYPLYDADNQSGGLFDATYVVSDINGDGYVDIFDYPIYDLNNQSNIQAILPY